MNFRFRLRLHLYAHFYFSLVGELDGIPEQINQDLTESPRVTQQGLRDVWLDLAV